MKRPFWSWVVMVWAPMWVVGIVAITVLVIVLGHLSRNPAPARQTPVVEPSTLVHRQFFLVVNKAIPNWSDFKDAHIIAEVCVHTQAGLSMAHAAFDYVPNTINGQQVETLLTTGVREFCPNETTAVLRFDTYLGGR